MLRVENIHFSYPEEKILDTIDFTIDKGQFVVIIGESGSGKSTLLQLIAGQLQPESGNIFLNDKRMCGPHEQLLPRHDEIRLLAQDFDLGKYYTTEENIKNMILHLEEDVIQDRIQYWLKAFSLENVAQNKAITLSGGQQQRLAWIRSLVEFPEVILLDEPTNQIDQNMSRQFLNAIKNKVKEEYKIAIMISHDGQEAMRWADQLIILKNKKILRKDTPQNIYKYPKSLFEAQLLSPATFCKEKYYRPHQLKLKKNNGEYTVTNCTYLGAFYEVTIKSTKNKSIIIHQENSLNIGEKVSLQYDSENI